MSINDDFYSHFPSLNSNSKEIQRSKRMSQEYEEYMKSLKKVSPKQTKSQQRIRRSRENVEVSSSSEVSTPSLDVIFSAEDRNRLENEKKEVKRRLYVESLERQIEEQKMKKLKDIERRQREEKILEERLQRQIETMKLQTDPLAEKVVERISLSENEKESYNDYKHNTSITKNNNQVYRYFSRSAKVDSDLFNYKKYFSDIMLDHDYSLKDSFTDDSKLEPRNVVALKSPQKLQPFEPQVKVIPEKPKINSCSSCTSHAECTRCHKKIVCNECNQELGKVSPDVTNHPELEYNEPDLPFSSKQQVVVYRPSDQLTPYSFNVEPNSQFYKDAIEDLKLFSEMKMSNYIKLYGDLRKQKREEHLKVLEKQAKQTGAIPKREIDKISRRLPEKTSTLTLSNSSDIDDLLENAQYTVITQLGFAKKQLQLDKLK